MQSRFQRYQEAALPELPPFDPEEPVKITTTAHHSSRRKLNQYTRGEKLGSGKHGDVYVCRDETSSGYDLAVKIVRKTNPRDKLKLLKRNYQQEIQDGQIPLNLNSTLNSIRKEIAIMKKCRHANLVRLVETIDDPRDEKIYMVMECLSGGPVEWSGINKEPVLMLQQTRRILRDTILGLEYLHHEGVIHRDIKPANILYTRDRRSVKLIDFGVAHFTPPSTRAKGKEPESSQDSIDPSLFPPSDLLKRTGSPAFLAPEVVWFSDEGPQMLQSPFQGTISPGSAESGYNQASSSQMPKQRPPITKSIDIWSLGVTFYCLLFGHLPFSVPPSEENTHQIHSEYVVYNIICTQEWPMEDYMGADGVPTGGRYPQNTTGDGSRVMHLLDQMLQKSPKHRITLPEIKANSWILKDIESPKEWSRLTSPVGDNGIPTGNWVKTASSKFLKLLPGPR
ncbi:other/CAMKK/ELM protein kinase [Flammula alnicola]|nr:other/CAMKK/ELM protein kinase [Flammula alnicola]